MDGHKACQAWKESCQSEDRLTTDILPSATNKFQQESSDDDDEKPVCIFLDNDEAHDLLSGLLSSQPTRPTLTNDLMN